MADLVQATAADVDGEVDDLEIFSSCQSVNKVYPVIGAVHLADLCDVIQPSSFWKIPALLNEMEDYGFDGIVCRVMRLPMPFGHLPPQPAVIHSDQTWYFRERFMVGMADGWWMAPAEEPLFPDRFLEYRIKSDATGTAVYLDWDLRRQLRTANFETDRIEYYAEYFARPRGLVN